MFLKAESFERNGVTITLSELPALQCIERLVLMRQQVGRAESDSNRQATAEDAIRADAFVMAASLWHNHPQRTKQPSMNGTVKRIEQEVPATWLTRAISHIENVVYRLSSMYGFVVNDAPNQAGDSGPAGPIPVGEYPTIS